MLLEPEPGLIPWEIAIVSDDGPITDSAKWIASSHRPAIEYHALSTEAAAGRSDLARRLFYSVARSLGAAHGESVVWLKDVFMGQDGNLQDLKDGFLGRQRADLVEALEPTSTYGVFGGTYSNAIDGLLSIWWPSLAGSVAIVGPTTREAANSFRTRGTVDAAALSGVSWLIETSRSYTNMGFRVLSRASSVTELEQAWRSNGWTDAMPIDQLLPEMIN